MGSRKNNTLGIIGGGQLGRMIALAAANLGYDSHIFTPELDCPASRVAYKTTNADYSDWTALTNFATSVHAIVYEFENIPLATVEYLEKIVDVRPGSNVLAISQDRLFEKDFIRSLGGNTTQYYAVNERADLVEAIKILGLPLILKTRRLGYDGKGQFLLRSIDQIDAAIAAIANKPAIAEGFVDFTAEVSLIATRDIYGNVAFYDLVQNHHRNHILAVTIAPITKDLADFIIDDACHIVRKILEKFDYVGVLSTEFFVTKTGNLLINELAPRVHNSGHWTIEGSITSQFTQSVRAAMGLPVGTTHGLGRAVMVNIIGDAINYAGKILQTPGLCLHLYGKTQASPGRKMGHVTSIIDKTCDINITINTIAAILHMPLLADD